MDGKKVVDSTLVLASIGANLAMGNYVAAGFKTIEALKDFGFAQQEARFGKWFEGFAKSEVWATPQEFQGVLEVKLKEDPKAKETVWAAAKAILETISDESAEVIGSLTAEYVRDSKGPDAFFRGAVRVLADLSTEELSIFRAIVTFGVSKGLSEVGIGVTNEGALQTAQQDDDRTSVMGDVAMVRRIVRSLQANHLCGEMPVFGGPPRMEWQRENLIRLASHLGVQH